MLNGQAQFLLCHHHDAAPSRLDPSRFPSHRVGTDRLVPVAAPGGVSLGEDGGALPFLAYNPESGLGRILAAALPEAVSARLDTVFTAHHAATLRTMARTGRGLAWLPESLVAEDLAAGSLRRAGPQGLEVALDIHLIRPLVLGQAASSFWALATQPAASST